MTQHRDLPPLPIVAYLRADKDGNPIWSEDCVCQDPVYPSDPDGSDADSVSMPLVRLFDAIAALTPPAPVVPEGWKLVPVEPTREMMDAMPGLPAIGAAGDMDLKNLGWSLKEIQNRHRWMGAIAATPTPPAQAQQSSVDAERAARQAAQVRVEELQAENIRLQSAADHACGLLKTQQAAGVPEASALVEALHKIKHKAVSLADAQVIALEALAAATEAAQVTDALKSARMATSQDDGRFRVVLQFTEFDDSNAVHSWLMSQGVLHYNGPGSHATQAQAAADARDAERYRMVRRGQHWSVINGIGDTLRGEDLDAAIDAVSVGQR